MVIKYVQHSLHTSHCSYLDISISPKFSEKKWWFCSFDSGSVKPQKIIFLTNEYEKKNWQAMKEKHNYHSVWNVYWAQCTLWQTVSGWSQLSSLSQFSEKDYHFLNLKMPLLSTHFISIFTRNCQIQCFLHAVPAMQQSWKFHCQIEAWNFQLCWIAGTWGKPRDVLSTLAKNLEVSKSVPPTKQGSRIYQSIHPAS